VKLLEEIQIYKESMIKVMISFKVALHAIKLTVPFPWISYGLWISMMISHNIAILKE